MPDLGHELLLGTFITPTNQAPQQAVALAQLTERAGLDLVTFQDHPYQAAFHDTWTLLSYVAARTERVRLAASADGRLTALTHDAAAPTARWKEFVEQTATASRINVDLPDPALPIIAVTRSGEVSTC